MAAVILCISYSGLKLGAAYYHEDTAEINILYDTAEDSNFFLLKSLLNEAKPTHVIVNKSQDREFIKKLCSFYNYSIPTDVANVTNTSGNETSKSLVDVSTTNRAHLPPVNESVGATPARNLTTAGERSLPSTANTAVLFQRLSHGNTTFGNATSYNNNGLSYKNIKNILTTVPDTTRLSHVADEQTTRTAVSECRGMQPANDDVEANAPKFPGSLPPSGTSALSQAERANEPGGTSADPGNIPEAETVEEDEDAFCPAISFFPNMAFGFGEAKKRLEKLFSDNVHDPRLLIAFRFDTTAFNMVGLIRALGALLRFLDQQRIGVEFESYEVKTPIKVIKTITLNDLLEVDSTTVLALEIFHSDYNPATIRRKFVFGRAKREGSSLFALCNICRCTPGRHQLRYWFECPTRCPNILAQRHEAISFFFHDCNVDAGRYLRNSLKDVMSVRGIVRRMHAGNVSINDWRNLYLTLCALVRIGEYLREREIRLKILADRMAFFGDELMRLANVFTEIVRDPFGMQLPLFIESLEEVIDFRESLSECRFVVNRGVDNQLDELKDTYDQLPEMLTSIARAEAEELGIESCSVAYVPIIGYLLVIPEADAIPGSALIQLIFSAEGMSHYKSRRMQRLDEQIGDVKMQIIDIETTVTLRLQRLVLQRADQLLHAVEAAATLDCVLSLAVIAREYNWVRPKFVGERIIDISNARHPVAELLCKSSTFVPNPIQSSETYGKVKILSGPNASGKSVYLKMVGVVVYLAHVGSFVPADRAIIGPINRIMSRMYTVDSVLDGMSSFANDLKQMSGAIRRSDGSSLLIIDEFGKGTVTEVGLSLLASCLNYWLEKETADACPHLFVASHFHALRNFLHDTDMISYKTMDVIRKENDELEFQFRLVDGVIDNSFATVTALKMGIPRRVVDRADEIYLHLKTGLSLVELNLVDNTESDKYLALSRRMESLLGEFRAWNMEADPRGFLALAREVLVSDDDGAKGQLAERPSQADSQSTVHTMSTQRTATTARSHSHVFTAHCIEREICSELTVTQLTGRLDEDHDTKTALVTQAIAIIQEQLIEPITDASNVSVEL